MYLTVFCIKVKSFITTWTGCTAFCQTSKLQRQKNFLTQTKTMTMDGQLNKSSQKGDLYLHADQNPKRKSVKFGDWPWMSSRKSTQNLRTYVYLNLVNQ